MFAFSYILLPKRGAKIHSVVANCNDRIVSQNPDSLFITLHKSIVINVVNIMV